MTNARISRPELTLPEAEAEAVRAAYAGASVILEYGSGGSTALAADMDGKTIYSVESDRKWATMMEGYFEQNPPKSTVHMHHVNIGPTKEWGHPVDHGGWWKYIRYPLSVWDRDDFQHPDVVLVDGRFRVGCVLATMMQITRPVTLLFDDYAGRDRYHEVLRYAEPDQQFGRMVRFSLTPRVFRPDEMLDVITLMQRPH